MSILLFILNIHIYISIINCSLFFTYHRHIASQCFWFTFPWLTIDAEKLFMHVIAIWIWSLKKKVYLSYFFWENSIKTCILSSVEQITSLGWMHETSTQGWCTGMIQRDGMGTEVGEGIRMGSTCKSMADSCQWMAKPLQYCKVISLQLIKINEKNMLLFLFKIWFLFYIYGFFTYFGY